MTEAEFAPTCPKCKDHTSEFYFIRKRQDSKIGLFPVREWNVVPRKSATCLDCAISNAAAQNAADATDVQ